MGTQLTLTLRQDVVNGFSYSFTASLLVALRKRRNNKQIFSDDKDNKDAKRFDPKSKNYEDCGNFDELTDIILSNLANQVNPGSDLFTYAHKGSVRNIDKAIQIVSDFLKIFQK